METTLGLQATNRSSKELSNPAESDLELGLGLSLGNGGSVKSRSSAWGEPGRILTAKDFPSRGFSSVSGTKRAADSVPHESRSPTSLSQIVGWPPVRAYRMNSLVNQAKTQRAEEDKEICEKDKSKDAFKKDYDGNKKTDSMVEEKGNPGFVKVNMDGVVIGRKVDLNAHSSYDSLALKLHHMFFRHPRTDISIGGNKEQETKISKRLDGSSEFVLTYEDKDGDWMLVGDVPWKMFVGSVKKLRIMKTSEANGLAPRCQGRIEKQRSKPV